MPLIVDTRLPAYKRLEKGRVLEMAVERARRQDIRPLEIGILNLMPSAVIERTELQLLRLLSNTPLQLKPTFIRFDTHRGSAAQDHLDAYYRSMQSVKRRGLDGLLITGANLEQIPFEEVRYWNEFVSFLDWAREHVTSTIFSCWAAHAALYHHHGIAPRTYRTKRFGIFRHVVHHEKRSPFTLGMDDTLFAPHSRWRGVETRDIKTHPELNILVESAQAGPHIIAGREGREVYVQGHPEYDAEDIAKEYFRDISLDIAINKPRNYFPRGDEKQAPLRSWSANGQVLYANWINWVYQTTNFDVKKPLMD